MNVILIFTYGISLKNWEENKIFDREILLYKHLQQKHNIKFTFLTFGDHEDLEFADKLDNFEIIPIYKYIKKSDFKIFNFLKTIYITFKLKALLSNNSLIKTNQQNGAWIGLILKFLIKKPLIIRTGYNLYEFSKNEKRSIYVRFFYYILTKISLLYSDSYLVTSKADKVNLKEVFGEKGNVLHFPNWVDSIVDNRESNRYENKVLSVGRLETQKNFSEIIESLKNENIDIDIVGEGSQKDSLLKFSKLNNVELNILEKMGFKDLKNIYKKYKIFISSSIFEGNPKVVLEAMANGCLVIARKNMNVEEIIKHNQNGIIYNSNEELKEQVKFYLENENERKNLVKNSIKTIKTNNLLDIHIDKEYALYKNLNID